LTRQPLRANTPRHVPFSPYLAAGSRAAGAARVGAAAPRYAGPRDPPPTLNT
ncbi:hypothetical protein GTY44_06965, partial [Streptomyces sp. SID5914]|nr:hypothetical protein [Streptomyces sp. SID5914]